MKICTKCKIEKDEAAFGKRSDRPTCLRSWCRACRGTEKYDLQRKAACAVAWRASHVEHRLAYNNAWKTTHPEEVKKHRKTQYVVRPERTFAQYTAANAIRAGKLVPLPCWVCGKEKVEAHHPNYDAPLDVVWLCRPHHVQLHKEASCLMS